MSEEKMMMEFFRKAFLSGIGLILLLVLFTGCVADDVTYVGSDVVANLSGDLDENFARAYEPIPFQFPLDHGAHPEYQTEWWYFTGNLADEQGKQYGYQFTIFRSALTASAPERSSNLATNQLYMAHLALTNAAAGRHVSFERFGRGDDNLAGAQVEPQVEIWLEDWSVQEREPGVWAMTASALSDAGESFALELTLSETRPPVLHGDAGLSQKGPEPGNASYYYSLIGLETSGSLTWAGEPIAVSGRSWMDHEFGSSALSENSVGWDWFSVQLDSGDALMLAQIRTVDGGLVDEMQGTFIRADGETVPLSVNDFEVEVLDEWTSPETGITYPSGWRLTVPEVEAVLEFSPLIRDQEMRVSYIYWEGAANVAGSVEGAQVTGEGFVELTGYGADGRGQRFQR